MKWTVLADNRSPLDTLETEHGLSICLETARHRLLLDTGATDVVVRNASRLSVDLSQLDYIFLSHGHSDHAGGLRHLMPLCPKAKVIVSPHALNGQFFSKRRYFHSITPQWPDIPASRLVLADADATIGHDLQVLAHIPQCHPLPKGNAHLFVQDARGATVNDDFCHELALYVDGLLFTGCAHSGLENILSACPGPVHTVVGGFHLLDGHETEQELTALARRLAATWPHTTFYTSHCTGDAVFATLQQVMGRRLQAFACGTVVEVP